jgi:hypothetical protein
MPIRQALILVVLLSSGKLAACEDDATRSPDAGPEGSAANSGRTVAGRSAGAGAAGRGGTGGQAAAAGSGGKSPQDAGPPSDIFSPEGRAYCMKKDKAFADFVAAHRACETDKDCAVVGDCGPNADFTAVAANAAKEAYELAKARCSGTFDGPIFDPRCTKNKCTLEERTDTCCGCPDDAGL